MADGNPVPVGGALQRVFANAARLAAGHLLAGLIGIIAMSLAARILGDRRFGELVLVQAYALTAAGIFRLNAEAVLVRYGVLSLDSCRRDDFRRLVALVAALDFAASVIALLVAELLLRPLLPLLGWSTGLVPFARFYLAVILALQTTTPLAILRMFDRFDLVARQRLVLPSLRLIGILPTLFLEDRFRIVGAAWFLAHLGDDIVAWGLALRELHHRRLLGGMRLHLRETATAHPGLLRMLVAVGLRGTAGLVSGRLATLLLGGMLGAGMAGTYRLALQVAGALERIGVLVRRVLEPELARMIAARSHVRAQRAVTRLSLLAVIATWPLLALVGWFAGPVLVLLGGPAFLQGQRLLQLLLVQEAALLASLPAATVLIMCGEAGRLLRVTAAARGLFVLLLMLLVPRMQLAGAGIASAAAGWLEGGWLMFRADAALRRGADPAGSAARRKRSAGRRRGLP